jgi:CDP-diacylglycerol pyrophosphatase
MTDANAAGRPHRSRLRLAVALLAAGLAMAALVVGYRLFVAHDGRLGLWRVVGEICVPAERLAGVPFPCLDVRLDRGWALVRAPFGGHEFLVVPTARVTGLEDPAARAPEMPDLWSVAWAERGRIAAAVGRPIPDDRMAFAINSRSARSQDQYHIHVDCLDADVRARLRAAALGLAGGWRDARPVGDDGPRYLIRRIALSDLARERPEALIARELAPRREQVSFLSFAVVGTGEGGGDPGLLLAATYGLGPWDGGHAEELMDHACGGD